MQKIFSKNEIPEIAKEILQQVESKQNTTSATLVALSGDLGAGKTTLTKEIAKQLGVTETVISPTFVIIKNYNLSPALSNDMERGPNKKIIHIDAYRLDSSQELLNLGWKELIENKNNLIILEWPEKVQDILPKENVIWVKLEHAENDKRTLIL